MAPPVHSSLIISLILAYLPLTIPSLPIRTKSGAGCPKTGYLMSENIADRTFFKRKAIIQIRRSRQLEINSRLRP